MKDEAANGRPASTWLCRVSSELGQLSRLPRGDRSGRIFPMATLQLPMRALPRQLLRRILRDERALLTFVLMLSSGFAVSLLAARVLRSGGWEYRFLVWNLFLAWMPFWLALAMEVLDRRQARR